MDTNFNFYIAGLICAGGVVVMGILFILMVIRARIFE